MTWTPGARPIRRPLADGSPSVLELTGFGDAVYALGSDGDRLAAWVTEDCGRSWLRVRDRDAFRLGNGTIRVTSIAAAATSERLLVVALGVDRSPPFTQWAWIVERDGSWRRIDGDLVGAFVAGLSASEERFWAIEDGSRGDGRAMLVTSADGEAWVPVGLLPGGEPPIWDSRSSELPVAGRRSCWCARGRCRER